MHTVPHSSGAQEWRLPIGCPAKVFPLMLYTSASSCLHCQNENPFEDAPEPLHIQGYLEEGCGDTFSILRKEKQEMNIGSHPPLLPAWLEMTKALLR